MENSYTRRTPRVVAATALSLTRPLNPDHVWDGRYDYSTHEMLIAGALRDPRLVYPPDVRRRRARKKVRQSVSYSQRCTYAEVARAVGTYPTKARLAATQYEYLAPPWREQWIDAVGRLQELPLAQRINEALIIEIGSQLVWLGYVLRNSHWSYLQNPARHYQKQRSLP
jgi:hypothetical protein